MNIEAIIAALDKPVLEQTAQGVEAALRSAASAPLRHRSFATVLAWRIQADAFGGLDEQTRKLLRDTRPPREPIVPPGTILTREWRGVRHQVEAQATDFCSAGRAWKSLSEVARAITGTRWNGPRFFGLREQRQMKAAALRDLHAQKLRGGPRPVVQQPRCPARGLRSLRASQKSEGWIALPTLYDDGGFSGGTMERPALKRLLDDIAAGRIDVVVVYKVDRLTRSLADFAKIVEVFDRQGVSFVSRHAGVQHHHHRWAA